jgi:hypothetical protein
MWAGLGTGVDDVDSYMELCNFIATVSEGSGVTHFIMHARKCLLKGLTPLQNRTIPPLRQASFPYGFLRAERSRSPLRLSLSNCPRPILSPLGVLP